MIVKLDEDLSPALLPLLRERGYEARTVHDQGWGGTKDDALWPLVQASQEFFITADKGFADVRNYPPGSHHGIVLLRADDQRIPVFEKILRALLDSHRLEDHVGHLIIATEILIRIRRP